MQFSVGASRYRLVISDRAIYDEDGNELEGLAVEGRRLLIVSYRVELERREEVALHELMHAWLFAVPEPRTNEERCNLAALVTRQYRVDLEAQGGEEALLQLPLTRVPHLGLPVPQRAASAQPEGLGATDRAVCGCCEAQIMCGSIHGGEPEQHPATNRWRVERWARCEACGTLTVWWEWCAADGLPSGVLVAVPRPRMLQGREADQWVKGQKLAVVG